MIKEDDIKLATNTVEIIYIHQKTIWFLWPEEKKFHHTKHTCWVKSALRYLTLMKRSLYMQSAWKGWIYEPETQAVVIVFPNLIQRPTAFLRTVNSTWHVLSSITLVCELETCAKARLGATSIGGFSSFKSSSSKNSSAIWLSHSFLLQTTTKTASNFTKNFVFDIFSLSSLLFIQLVLCYSESLSIRLRIQNKQMDD